MLDADARAYWDKRNIIGRPRHAYFTDGFYRHGMLGRFIGLAHLLAKLARIDLNGAVERQADDARTHAGARSSATGCFIRRWPA